MQINNFKKFSAKFIRSRLSFLKLLLSKYFWIIFLIIFFFLSGLFSSYAISGQNKFEIFGLIADKFSGFNTNNNVLFYQIFLNNLIACSITVFTGFFIILPFFITFDNGLMSGIIIQFITRLGSIGEPVNHIQMLVSIIPHSLIELPVILISIFFSIIIALKIIFVKKIECQLNRRKFILEILLIQLFILSPLLFLAAFIESFISYPLSVYVSEKNSQYETRNIGIDKKLVSKDEVGNSGLKEKSEMVNQNAIENGWLNAKMTSMILFNDSYYKEFKNNIPLNYDIRKYITSDKHTLTIRILEFDSSKSAQTREMIYPKLLNSIKLLDKNYFLENTDNYFKSVYQGKTSYFAFDSIGKYLYSINYSGNDLELFKKVFILQKHKLL
jgi:stage II sporulation protein M